MVERHTDQAFTLLRPVLKDLKLQKLKEEPTIVLASAHRNLITAGMGRWVIVARQASLPPDKEGCVSIGFDEKRKIFLAMIQINKDLFVDDSISLRVQRKIVGVHEFVHCAAHMLLSSFLKSERYIEVMKRSMITKVQMTTSDEFIKMVSAIGKLGTRDGAKYEVFTDAHFRLYPERFMDGFIGNYAELYTSLLLSYQLVSETMTAAKLQYENIGISELLTLAIDELIQRKALDKKFVLGRIKLFLPRLFSEFL